VKGLRGQDLPKDSIWELCREKRSSRPLWNPLTRYSKESQTLKNKRNGSKF